MNLTKRILFLFIVFFFAMCKQKPVQQEFINFDKEDQPEGYSFYPIKEPINVDFDHPENTSLFDYFSSIELIPIDNSPDVLVAPIHKIIEHGNKYCLFDARQSVIHVCDSTGKYLFKINKKGQGPGEYSMLSDVNINPFSGNLELLSPNGLVYIYDLSGKYIETKQAEYPNFDFVHLFAPLYNNTHVFYARFQNIKLHYFNLDEKKLLREEFEDVGKMDQYTAVNSLYSFQNDWFFFRPSSSVVYHVGVNGLEKAFQFNFGKYSRENTKAAFSRESGSNSSEMMEEWFENYPYCISRINHNNNYIFVKLLWKDKERNANIIYDKSTKKCRFILDFKENVTFSPHVVTDEYALRCCSWVNLKEFIKSEMLDDTKKKVFDELIQSEDETNPVLIKYWFK